MKKSILGATILSILCISVPPAQSADVIFACAADVDEYCDAVEVGHGRLLACLYAHELVISDGCDAAIGDAADILDTMFTSLRYIQEECGADIQKMCNAVAPGEGRIFTCLAENRDDLSESCAAVAQTIRLPGE